MSTCPVDSAPTEPKYLQPERELQTILWYCHSEHTRSRHSQTCDLYHSPSQAAHQHVDNPIYGIFKPLQAIPCLRAWRPAYLNHEISQHSSHAAQFALARQTNQGYPQPALVLVLTQVWATQKKIMLWYEERVLTADSWWSDYLHDTNRNRKSILAKMFAHESEIKVEEGVKQLGMMRDFTSQRFSLFNPFIASLLDKCNLSSYLPWKLLLQSSPFANFGSILTLPHLPFPLLLFLCHIKPQVCKVQVWTCHWLTPHYPLCHSLGGFTLLTQ